MAQLRRRSRSHAVLAARSDQRRQLRQARDRVAVQDRQPRSSPGISIRIDAADGQGRRLLDGGIAPRGGRARRRDGRAALDAQRERGGARRGRAAAAVGPRARVLERRRGRRSDPVRHAGLSPDRAERADRRAGRLVRRARRRRSEERQRPGDGSHHRRDRPAFDADGREERRDRRRRAQDRRQPEEPAQREGLRPRVRRADGQASLDLPHDSAARRIRQRHLGEGLVVVYREHRRVGADLRRRRARPGVSAGGDADRRLLRRPSSRQRPVWRKPRRRRSADRKTQVALPVRPSRDLGPRFALRADSRGHHGQRPHDQGGGAAVQAGVALRPQSRDRRADLADRRAAGPEGRRAGRVVRARRSRFPPNRRPTSARACRSTI